jgi:putative ABC transport system permease protein
MLKNYLKIAVKVLLRRKFFTFISLFGISFTLVVLMVATAILDHTFAPFPPELRQDRTLVVYRAHMTGPHSSSTGPPGYALLDTCARNLPGVERISIFSVENTVFSYVGGGRIQSTLKRTDGEFWKILSFAFVEGSPYTNEDVDRAAFVAVINQTTRDRFFGGASAYGRFIEADGQRFRVVGVVPDVPVLRQVSHADIWVPLTTAKTDAWKQGLLGGVRAIVLARSAAGFAGMKEEFESRVRAIKPPDSDYVKIESFLETPFEAVAGELLSNRDDRRSHPERLWAILLVIAFLFMLLPTVNLVNLNVSRIMERASEIGVRKAFGASSRTLVGQFIVENLVLTLVGGAIGLFGSFFVLRGLNDSGLIAYSQFSLNYRVFGYGLLISVVFALLSGVFPAWRMSRLHPVNALRGGSR